ncbi:MAG: translation elongation factor P [bacterium]|nr:translation elongation factor P [bacterium]
MIIASHLKAGMAIRHEGHTFKVLSAEYHPGQGKMGGATHAHLLNLDTGTLRDHGFRADLKLDVVPLEKAPMEFLYRDGDLCVFMSPETYEQVEIPELMIGKQAELLQAEMRVAVEFLETRPVSVTFPDVLEVRIADTAPPVHNQQDNTKKPAKLESGVEILVPQFIKTGDSIRLDVHKLEYMERAKSAGKQ